MKISKEKFIEISIILALVIILTFFSTRKVYQIELDGIFLGYTNSVNTVNDLADSIMQEQANIYKLKTIYPVSKFTFTKTNKRGKKIISQTQLAEKITQFQSYEFDGFVLIINNNPMAYSSSLSNLENIVSNVKTHFMGEYDTLEQVKFKEPVSIEKIKLQLKDLSSKSDLISLTDLLINGINNQDKYVVKKGDTASAIAQNHNMTLSNLAESNPNINISKISIGQIINISKPEKILHIQK